MDGFTHPEQWFDLLPPPEARWPRGGELDRLLERLEQHPDSVALGEGTE
jgi:hypothetical protein